MSVGPIEASRSELRFFGLASGIDIDEVVEKLMQVERIPLDRLEQRRQLLIWTKEAYLGIYSLVDKVRQSLLPLKLASTFQARTASSSDERVVTVAASSGALPGTHEIDVVQLATGVRATSGASISRSTDKSTLWSQLGLDPSVTSFTLRLETTDSRGTHTLDLTFDLNDPARNDINDLVRAINESDLGLTAYYDSTFDRLFVTSRETGATVNLTVTDASVTLAGGGTANVWQDLLQMGTTSFAGQDAIFNLDGASGLRSATNQFTLGGITYTLQGTGQASVVVTQDTDAIVQAVKTFIDAYNELVSTIDQKVRERRLYDYPPLTDAQKKELTEEEIKRWEERARQGLLQGDALLLGIARELRSGVASPVSGIGSTYTTLSSVGITTASYQDAGRLYLDEAKFRQALESDPEGVLALFTATGSSEASQGIAVRLGESLNDAVERIRLRAGVSGLDTDQSGLGRQIRLLDSQIEAMENRLAQLQVRYYRQYSLMEQVIAQMSAQSAWLFQVFLGQAAR